MPSVIAHPEEAKEQVKALFLQGLTPSRIEASTGIKASTVSQWATRKKWVALRDGLTLTIVKPGGKTVLSEPRSRLADLSQSLREQMADILQAQTSKLAKLSSPSTVNGVRAIAATLEPLARTAKLVHDWGSDRPIGIVLAGELAQVNIAACGIGTTSPSVPALTDAPIDTTSAQVIDVQAVAEAPINDNLHCAKPQAEQPTAPSDSTPTPTPTDAPQPGPA